MYSIVAQLIGMETSKPDRRRRVRGLKGLTSKRLCRRDSGHGFGAGKTASGGSPGGYFGG